MFKYINQHHILSSNNYVVSEDILYFSENGIVFQKDIVNNIILKELNAKDKIYLLLNNETEILVFFSSKGKRILKETFTLINDANYDELVSYQQIPFNNLQFILVGEDILETKCGLYDISQKKILWVRENPINPIIVSGYFFSNLFEKIERRDLQTGNLIWSFSVIELGRHYLKLEKKMGESAIDIILGIYKEVLWLCLKNGLLLGIDINTGKILHQVGAPIQYPSELNMMEDTRADNLFYNRYSFLDKKNGKIIRLWHAGYNDNDFDWYFETDLNQPNPQLVISKVENATQMPFVIDGNPCPIWPFDDEYIYVCNYRDCILALFGRNKKRIEWVVQMEMEPNPEARDNRKSFATRIYYKNGSSG